MHSKISEVIHGSVLCLTLISLSGATVFKIFVNIFLKLDQASLIFEAKKQLSHYCRGVKSWFSWTNAKPHICWLVGRNNYLFKKINGWLLQINWRLLFLFVPWSMKLIQITDTWSESTYKSAGVRLRPRSGKPRFHNLYNSAIVYLVDIVPFRIYLYDTAAYVYEVVIA